MGLVRESGLAVRDDVVDESLLLGTPRRTTAGSDLAGFSFLPAKRRKIRRMDTAAPSERQAKNGNEDQSKRRPVRIRRSADLGKGCSGLTVAVRGTFVVLALTFASRLDIQAGSE